MQGQPTVVHSGFEVLHATVLTKLAPEAAVGPQGTQPLT